MKQSHRPSHFEASIAQLSPSLQNDMRALKKQEARILELLKNPATAERFLSEPLAVLQEHGVEVPPTLARQLGKFDPTLAQHLKQQAFALPSGKTVTAQIKVRFTKGG